MHHSGREHRLVGSHRSTAFSARPPAWTHLHGRTLFARSGPPPESIRRTADHPDLGDRQEEPDDSRSGSRRPLVFIAAIRRDKVTSRLYTSCVDFRGREYAFHRRSATTTRHGPTPGFANTDATVHGARRMHRASSTPRDHSLSTTMVTRGVRGSRVAGVLPAVRGCPTRASPRISRRARYGLAERARPVAKPWSLDPALAQAAGRA